MQFHLNGFRAGDPDVKPAADGSDLPAATEVDVLIIGCGPAGLTLAAQLAAFPEISTRIVERKAGPMERGQADGISCRSMEMFQAFGFAEKVKREAYWVNETTFWTPDPEAPDQIHRDGRVQDVEDGLSEMPHVILNQARVHDRYLEVMRNAPTRLVPEYGKALQELQVADQGTHPVSATLAVDGGTETIRARYVVGCDGARSRVRQAIGLELKGDRAGQAWGVMDVLAVTDFPDWRFKCLIKSQGKGNIILIPREGGHMVRVYVELDALAQDLQLPFSDLTADHLIGAANQVFHPYALDVKEIAWWSVYEVGHSLTDRFDNLPSDEAPGQPRVFIAGDACHTHSAKAGQGMNVSMGDSFNLGWKLIHVLRGQAAPDLLRSYSAERQSVAQDLIDFDHRWSRLIGAPGAAGDAPEFRSHFIEHGRYTAGVTVRYRPSAITGPATWQGLAPGFVIGTRFHSAPVVRLADAKAMQLGHVVEADARWRLFAFAPQEQALARMQQLCSGLAPVLKEYARKDFDTDHPIDLRAVFQIAHTEVEITAVPDMLFPAQGRLGLRDYEKVFCPDAVAGDIFDLRQIDRAAGCLVIVRPDQHVAHVLPFDATDELAGFLGMSLLTRQ